VETLGVAFAAGWRVTARRAWGKREGMKSKRECHYRRELDLETLVWTRGPNFPLSRLDGRLMCPRLPVASGGGAVSTAIDIAPVDEQGTKPVIPNRSNRKQLFSFSKRLYKLRWRIEAAFNK
jgi:hypothetical protein